MVKRFKMLECIIIHGHFGLKYARIPPDVKGTSAVRMQVVMYCTACLYGIKPLTFRKRCNVSLILIVRLPAEASSISRNQITWS